MRTTVDIPDVTYRRLKAKAARQGCSVRQLILRGVERELAPPRADRRAQLPLVRATKPGTLSLTNEQIYEIVPFP
jgi:predicted alpha/beta hydrolase